MAGVGFLLGVQNFQVQDSNFTENYSENQSGVFFLNSVKYSSIKNSIFENNKAQNSGGCITTFGNSTDLEIIGSTFNNNYASSGGAVYIIQLENLNIINSNFVKNTVKINGGAFSILLAKTIFVEDSTYKENQAFSGVGGGFDIKNNQNFEKGQMGFHFNNTLFKNNSALQGGGIFMSQIGRINQDMNSFQNLSFSNNSASSGNGGAIYMELVLNQIIIKDTIILGNFALMDGGGFAFYNVKDLELKNNTFNNNSAKQNGGGIFTGRKCNNIQIIQGKFNNNEALQYGGGIKISETYNSSLSHLYFEQNSGKKAGGAISAEESKELQFNQMEVFNNTSQQGAGIIIDYCEQFEFKNLKIAQNFASNSGAGIVITESAKVDIMDSNIIENNSRLNVGGILIYWSQQTHMHNVSVNNNTSLGEIGGVSVVMSQDLLINNTYIQNNIANAKVGGISVYNCSQIILYKVDIIQNINKITQGGGVFLYGGKGIVFNQTKINENWAQLSGGGITAIESREFLLIDSQIVKNKVLQSGGGFLIQGGQHIQIQSTQIHSNSAKLNGAGGLVNQVKRFEVYSSSIHENIAQFGEGGGLEIQDTEFVILNNTNIINNTGNQMGGGILVERVETFEIHNFVSQNNTAKMKGQNLMFDSVLFIKISKGLIQFNEMGVYGTGVQAKNGKKIEILESKFKNNTAIQSGGAIFVENFKEMIIQNSQFENNAALKDKGGHVYSDKCEQILIEYSKFSYGRAFNRGGGLYLLNSKNTLLQKNQIVNNQVYYNSSLSIYEKNQDFQLSFGGGVYFEPKLIDVQERTQFVFKNNQIDNCMASSGGGVLINQKIGQNIEIEFENNTFSNNIADIGPSARFLGEYSQILQNDIQKMYKNEKNFQNMGIVNKNKDVFFGFYYNERQIDINYSDFALCLNGSYLEKGGDLLCGKCLSNGICDGGYIPISPQEGYWRDSNDTFNFYYCEKNPELCLGRDQCKEGHMGLLCEVCDKSKNYSFEITSKTCKLCDTRKWPIILRLISLVLVFICFLSGQIYGITLRINKRLIQKTMGIMFNIPFTRISQMSASTKIFIMHFQILHLILSYELKELQYFSTSFEVIGSPQVGFTRSLDCLIQAEENEQGHNLSYIITIYGFLIMVGCAVFVILLENIFYLLRKCIKDKIQLLEHIKSTLLCFILLVQPSLIQFSLSYLTSRSINGVSYCQADPNILIDSDHYQNEVFPINLVATISLGVIFPFFLAYKLYKGNKKKQLERVSFQRKYGILFLEYKMETYFWEVIVCIIKGVVVFLSIQLKDDLPLKGVITIFLLIAYMLICIKIFPYKTKILNQMSIFSCLVLILSIGSFIGIKESQLNQNEKKVVSLVIILCNTIYVLFLGYIILEDFRMILRVKLIQICKSFKKFEGYMKEKTTKEMKAKMRWAKIKKSIHSAFILQKSRGHNGSFSVIEQEIISQYSDNNIQSKQQISHPQQQSSNQLDIFNNNRNRGTSISISPKKHPQSSLRFHFNQEQLTSTPEIKPNLKVSMYKQKKRSFQLNSSTRKSSLLQSLFETNITNIPKTANQSEDATIKNQKKKNSGNSYEEESTQNMQLEQTNRIDLFAEQSIYDDCLPSPSIQPLKNLNSNQVSQGYLESRSSRFRDINSVSIDTKDCEISASPLKQYNKSISCIKNQGDDNLQILGFDN